MVTKTQALDALKTLRAETKERKFTQKVEFVINLKDINLKKPEEQVEFFTRLPHSHMKRKVCAIVAGELEAEAKKVCDFTITRGELENYKKDQKAAKKLADEYHFFLAQANIMGQVAGAFGRVFGPRGKMPNPKAGCVVPPKATLGTLYQRLQSTVKISAKKYPVIQLVAGTQDMTDDELAENIAYLFDQVVHHLPRERHNIRGSLIKLTMGKPVKLA